jgi:hypothetical protein
MKLTIENASQFRDEFRQCGRHTQFSYEALDLLFDYFEEIDPDYDLDVIALCCEYSEHSVSNIARNYGIDLSECSDGVCTASAYGLGQVAKCEADTVLAYLNDHTSVVGVTPSGIVYAQF